MTRLAGLAVAALALASGPLLARQAEPRRPTAAAASFPERASIVWIDVNAVDSGQRPITSLGRDDFEVTEGGERRPILAFVAPDDAGQVRIACLVEDVLMREPCVERARDVLRRLVSGSAAGDRVLLAAASGVSASAALPGDGEALLAQLGRLRADPDGIARLRDAGETRSLHARRVDAVVSALGALSGEATSRALVLAGPPLPYEADASGASLYERVMRASARAAAPVYFLGCSDSPLAVPKGALGSDWADASGGVARAAPLLPVPRSPGFGARPLVFDAVARDSGGLAADNAGTWDRTLELALARARARYLLGIASVPSSWDGRFHAVSVRTRRKGVRLDARRGYFAPAPGAAREP